VLQSSRERREKRFVSVEAVGELRHPYARDEARSTIFLRRALNTPLSEVRPQLEHWS
jgi:hypothetical protein